MVWYVFICKTYVCVLSFSTNTIVPPIPVEVESQSPKESATKKETSETSKYLSPCIVCDGLELGVTCLGSSDTVFQGLQNEWRPGPSYLKAYLHQSGQGQPFIWVLLAGGSSSSYPRCECQQAEREGEGERERQKERRERGERLFI